jgi:predicted membrane-bound mannosyltransferase
LEIDNTIGVPAGKAPYLFISIFVPLYLLGGTGSGSRTGWGEKRIICCAAEQEKHSGKTDRCILTGSVYLLQKAGYFYACSQGASTGNRLAIYMNNQRRSRK